MESASQVESPNEEGFAAFAKRTGDGTPVVMLNLLAFKPGGPRPAGRGLLDDLASARRDPAYLNSASELLDRSAGLLAESATLVHENERRWRVFAERVAALLD